MTRAHFLSIVGLRLRAERLNHKDDTFLYKTGLFHAFMSLSLRVPIQILKYVKNGHIFSEVLLTLHVPRGDPQTTFHSPACTILITLVFVL